MNDSQRKPQTPRQKTPRLSRPREIKIDFSYLEPYECGAILVTLLAYPEPDAAEQTLALVHGSLCHLYLRAQSENNPEWANSPQLIKPVYAFMTSNEVDKALRQLKRRLRDRMVAARMGMAYLKEVATGKVPPLPAGATKLSLNNLSPLVLNDLDSDDESNVETRVWRPSLPVIHLATATAVVKDQIERELHQAISFVDLIAHPELVRGILDNARIYADLFCRSKSISISPNTLIQVSVIG